MSDLITGNTSYPTGLDTATLLADDTDEIVVNHLNGFGKALVAVETALGVSPAGTAASLADRLANVVSLDGGLLYGITAPVAPSNLPHFFYNTQTDVLYVRNPNTAAYDVIANATTLGDYLRKNSADTITAQHTFSPAIAQAPFLLSANAQGQKVTGLNADNVDGYDLDQGVKIADSPTFVTVTGSTSVNTDTINEKTAATGVTIDSVLLKDNTVTATTVTANTSIVTDTISEKTGAAGVTIDGVLLKDSQVTTDVINEKTSAAGVTIDSLLIKDGGISDGTNIIKTKIIDIGDWNMDTTVTVGVAHGLDSSKIRSVTGVLRWDTDNTGVYVIGGASTDVTTPVVQSWFRVAGSTTIQIYRLTGGVYDNTTFDATSYNRGWITITYIA